MIEDYINYKNLFLTVISKKPSNVDILYHRFGSSNISKAYLKQNNLKELKTIWDEVILLIKNGNGIDFIISTLINSINQKSNLLKNDICIYLKNNRKDDSELNNIKEYFNPKFVIIFRIAELILLEYYCIENKKDDIAVLENKLKLGEDTFFEEELYETQNVTMIVDHFNSLDIHKCYNQLKKVINDNTNGILVNPTEDLSIIKVDTDKYEDQFDENLEENDIVTFDQKTKILSVKLNKLKKERKSLVKLTQNEISILFLLFRKYGVVLSEEKLSQKILAVVISILTYSSFSRSNNNFGEVKRMLHDKNFPEHSKSELEKLLDNIKSDIKNINNKSF